VGFWGVWLGSGIGVPFAAAEPRISAAVFGLAGGGTLAKAAARITTPVGSCCSRPPPRGMSDHARGTLLRMTTGRDELDQTMMAAALAQARASLAAGGVPVGAVLAAGADIVAEGHNERVQLGDPVAHGEIACLRNAGRQSSYRGMTLYTTLSPCEMCTGAILLFQIPRIVVGEAETFAGDLGFLADRGVAVTLLNDERCQSVMREFQERYPAVWSEDIGGR